MFIRYQPLPQFREQGAACQGGLYSCLDIIAVRLCRAFSLILQRAVAVIILLRRMGHSHRDEVARGQRLTAPVNNYLREKVIEDSFFVTAFPGSRA